MNYSKHKIAVYGSLLSGLGNHRVLGRHIETNDAKLLGTTNTGPNFSMYSVHDSYPAITKGWGRVEIEVYEVSDEALESVRMLEGWNPSNTGYYREEIIKTEFGDAIIYVFNMSVKHFTEVKPQIGALDLELPISWRAYKEQPVA